MLLNLYNSNTEKLHQLIPCILGLNFRAAEDLHLCLKNTKTADHACEKQVQSMQSCTSRDFNDSLKSEQSDQYSVKGCFSPFVKLFYTPLCTLYSAQAYCPKGALMLIGAELGEPRALLKSPSPAMQSMKSHYLFTFSFSCSPSKSSPWSTR